MTIEIQDMPPKHPYPLDLVGVKDVKYRVHVKSPEGIIEFPVKYSAYVRLATDRRGVHLSRNVEAFIESLLEAEMVNPESLEALMRETVSRLLIKHDYSDYAQAEIQTEYFLKKGKIMEPIQVSLKAEAWRNGGCRWILKLGIIGITACPHAQVNIANKLGISNKIAPTHMQRAILRVSITFYEQKVYRIEEIAQVLYDAFSAPTSSLLKKSDEANLIIEAHKNPKLVEDVARDALKLLDTMIDSPSEICVEVESFESIHPYNVIAKSCIKKMSKH